MARGSRKESKTGYYHVMARGNNREMIFKKSSEKQYYLEQLQHKVDEGGISLVAYCLMDNHVHVLIYSDLESMTQALKSINIKFASRYNSEYERVGHVFQDRYKSEVINTDGNLINVMRYIHNNPVKAKMVLRAADYKWSSYRAYIGEKDKLIDLKKKKMIVDMFSGSIEEYEQFHLKEETDEFLEVKEDLEREREERASKIIGKYCKKYRVKTVIELHESRKIVEEIIIELIKKSNLSHRRIAELTGITRGVVHSIAKKL